MKYLKISKDLFKDLGLPMSWCRGVASCILGRVSPQGYTS